MFGNATVDGLVNAKRNHERAFRFASVSTQPLMRSSTPNATSDGRVNATKAGGATPTAAPSELTGPVSWTHSSLTSPSTVAFGVDKSVRGCVQR